MGSPVNSTGLLWTLVKSCSNSTESKILLTSWFTVYMLLLPLFLFILCTVCKTWTKPRSTKSSHSDLFTFHMVLMEMVTVVGSAVMIYGFFAGQFVGTLMGILLCSFSSNGEICFHCLTCGERYLAVVHPITYLHLKKRGGVVIRNDHIGLAWLVSLMFMLYLFILSDSISLIITSALMLSSLAFVSFCSVSVLCVLIRPGPGEGGGNRKRIDKSKRAAFYTILAILGVLLVRLVQHLVLTVWTMFQDVESCVMTFSSYWFSLPSSLVLPLLFLHRNGKLRVSKLVTH